MVRAAPRRAAARHCAPLRTTPRRCAPLLAGPPPLDCTCAAEYFPGDLVVAAVNFPQGNVEIPIGSVGTVVCGRFHTGAHAERERSTEREEHREREAEREKQRERSTQREKHREREAQRERSTEREKHMQRERSTQREKHRDQVDFRRFVRMWEAKKHELALFKEFGNSRVIDRFAAVTRHSPLT